MGNHDADGDHTMIRNGGTLRTIAVIFGMGVALGGMIWSAATVNAAVTGLNVTVIRLEIATTALRQTVVDILVQQGRQGAELESLKAQLNLLETRKLP